jgi:hypothetical protein
MRRLGGPCSRIGAEIVIVAPMAEADVVSLRDRYADARILPAPADVGENDLRCLGILEASGDIVAFTGDGDVRGEEWLAVLERRARTHGAYGPTPNGTIDWARYLQERGLLERNGRLA